MIRRFSLFFGSYSRYSVLPLLCHSNTFILKVKAESTRNIHMHIDIQIKEAPQKFLGTSLYILNYHRVRSWPRTVGYEHHYQVYTYIDTL